MKTRIINTLMIIVGLAIAAFGIVTFILQKNLLIGGVTGLGRFISHYTDWPISLVIAAISIILLIIAYLSMGKKFAFTIVLSTFFYPFFIYAFERIPQLANLTDNALLSVLFGASLAGIGTGIVIRAGASTGGSDVIPIILNHKFGIPIPPVVWLTDTIILLLQCMFANKEEFLLGIVFAVISATALNKILLFGVQDVQFTIISDDYEKINLALQQEAKVGTTRLHSTTGYRAKELEVIICIVSPKNVHKVRSLILNIDPNAFMTIINVSEVKGKGFSLSRI